MNKTRILTALACILLLTSVASFAHEPHEAKVLVKVGEADDLVELDLSGLEVGESKQLFSGSGKEIVVTREENGYKIDVDGEELHVQPFGDDLALGEGEHKVFLSENGDVVKLDDDHQQVWISAGGEEESSEEVSKIMARGLIGIGDGKVLHTGHAERVLTLEGESIVDRLAKSGLLDDLDEETRQKILDYLKNDDEPKVIRVKTVVVTDDEDE